MTRDTTAATDRAPLPAGLTVRAIRPEHYRTIYLAARDAWQGLPFATEDYHAYLADTVETPGFDAALCRVAWAGDEVAGLVLCRRNGDEAFILDVAVRKAWQRRGIAHALLAGCLHNIGAVGIEMARLYVDAESVGACRLYEGIGFRAVKEHVRYQKPCAPTP